MNLTIKRNRLAESYCETNPKDNSCVWLEGTGHKPKVPPQWPLGRSEDCREIAHFWSKCHLRLSLAEKLEPRARVPLGLNLSLVITLLTQLNIFSWPPGQVQNEDYRQYD